MTTLITNEAVEIYHPETERYSGPPSTLEHYRSPDGAWKLYITTAEREDFEEDTGARLEADVLEAPTWLLLVDWARENAGLCDL